MADRIIQTADLGNIFNTLRSLNSDINEVSGRVHTVGQELSDTRSELAKLEQLIQDFIEKDGRAKEIALAETRLVKIRQELDNKFTHYSVVRRHATGILQASDIQLVRQETLRGATEEHIISAPRYWLAPALVALSAWLNDNRPLAERALAEAIRRDDEKTSLFFGLIARRSDRNDLNLTWLDRYFGLQNPYELNRQTVIMIDALANGIFGANVTRQCDKRIEAWIAELSEQVGFAEKQRQQWSLALSSKTPNNDYAQTYPHLQRYSSTWQPLNQALNNMAMQERVLKHFEDIFEGEIRPAQSVLIAVDDLLTKLVSSFDEEELPLRREERKVNLIIEESGNRHVADQRFQQQSVALESEVDFTQLLTNAAMHPEMSHVTRATQRFSVAHSRDWIIDGHADITATVRQSVPMDISVSLNIGAPNDWSGRTHNGENEAELLRDLDNNIGQLETTTLKEVKFSPKHWVAAAVGALLVLSATSYGGVALLLGIACLLWVFFAHRGLEAQRTKIRANYAKLRQESSSVLRACLAEVVELRRDIEAKDAYAEKVQSFVESISPEQHVLSSYDAVRRVMNPT